MSPSELVVALRACATVLEQHADALDRLDAPDAWEPDTGKGAGPRTSEPDDPTTGPGTDLTVTLAAGCEAVGDSRDLSTICRRLVEGATGAAATPAGQRLAGFLAGAGDALRNADRIDGTRLALALEAGAERVTEVDDGAHPGCLLAVMSAVADGALGASDRGARLDEVLVAAADAGLEELEQGPLVDARLAERGTVDAAAAGFLLVLDALAAFAAGDPLPEPPRDDPDVLRGRPRSGERFVVRCRLTPPAADIEAAADLEEVVHELSDRLEFAGSGPCWAVESVTAFPGAVVEALAGAGDLSEVLIGLADRSG
jgi:dihydroxyacetone kinase-like predicted kinase